MTIHEIANDLSVSHKFIQKRVSQHEQENKEWSKQYLDSSSRIVTHYHPDLVAKIREEVESRPDRAPEGWMTRGALIQELKVFDKFILKEVSKYEAAHPEWFQEYLDRTTNKIIHYHPDLVAKIREEVSRRELNKAPEGWRHTHALSRQFNTTNEYIKTKIEILNYKFIICYNTWYKLDENVILHFKRIN